MEHFQGKTAVITGAGSGIGRGMALTFAREGMQIVVSDVQGEAARLVASEIVAAGGKAIGIETDVSDLGAVQRLAAAASEVFGAVHVLCNNAGVSVRRRGTEATPQDWQWVLGVNLWGVIHGIETFLPGMLAQTEQCHIVNTSSMNGIFPSAFSAMYSTSKYAILGLSETMANELSGTNVDISILCPASVATRIHESERNRPESLTPSSPAGMHVRSSTFDLSPPLDPLVVGKLVLNGIRLRQLHIFTDMKIIPIIKARHEKILCEFEQLAKWQSASGGD